MATPSGLMMLLALLQAGHVQHQSVPLFADLGDHRMPITTSVPKAQDFFNQGIRLSYGFNHYEAIAAFTEGTRLDPDCAMCYWGIAFAYGPNINLPMDSASGAEAHRAAQRAVALAGRVSPREQAYIRALAQRYGTDPSAQSPARDSGYARAMREVADRYPDDLDAQVLHADALMNLSPWTYWVGDRPRPDTPEILRRLESALARNRNHPGACHVFIHAVEAAFPARAVDCAERLAGLMPGAGHIVHMPAHIYIRVGRYHDAVRANEHAVHVDETYIADRRPGMGVYTGGYYPHNYHFLAFAATLAGQGDVAVRAARQTVKTLPPPIAGVALAARHADARGARRSRLGHRAGHRAARACGRDRAAPGHGRRGGYAL